MSKDLWIQAHDELVEEYMEDNPSVSWTEAYDRCAEHASERMGDNLADQIDLLNDESRENPDNVTVSNDRYMVTGFNPKEAI